MGRRGICKHMIALDLGIFPNKEEQIMDDIEEQNALYEKEHEEYMRKQERDIIDYVKSLSKAQLRDKLFEMMMNNLYEDDRYY